MRTSRAVGLFLVLSLVVPIGPAAGTHGGPAIAGTVQSDEGSPLEAVCVELENAVSGDFVGTVQTDAEGRFAFDQVDDGHYMVGFNTCANAVVGWVGEWWPGNRNQTAATAVAVVDGHAGQSLDVSLSPAGIISGTVTAEGDGTPLAGICVSAFEEQFGGTADATTGEDGTYRIGNIGPGHYIVSFKDCGEPYTRIGEVYPNIPAYIDLRSDAGRYQRVEVTSGEEDGGIDAALDEGGVIEGSVTAAHTGLEVPLVCVGADPVNSEDDSNVGAQAVTGVAMSVDRNDDGGDTGGYTMTDLPPGEYEIVFNDPECNDPGYATETAGTAQTTSSRTAAALTAHTVTVTAGQVVQGPSEVLQPLPSTRQACRPDVEGEAPPPGSEDAEEEEGPYQDLPRTNVHYRSVICASEHGVATGTGAGLYDPSGLVRRDQMAAFIARLLKTAGVTLPASPVDHFHDDKGNTHELAINQLADLGVVGGKGGGRYAPKDRVSRGQMATFLMKAYETASGNTLRSSGNHFTDDRGHLHEASINKVTTAGIAAGVGGTRYAPDRFVQRDQMASFLMRNLDRVARDTNRALTAASRTAASGQVSAQGSYTAQGNYTAQNHDHNWYYFGRTPVWLHRHVRVNWVVMRVWQLNCPGVQWITQPASRWSGTFWCWTSSRPGIGF